MTSLLAGLIQIHGVFSLTLLPFLFQLLGIGLLLLLIAALLAPFESLGWWAGWFGRSAAKNTAAPSEQKASDMQVPAEARHYLVYLSGIEAISGDFLETEEIDLCDQLAARFPGTIVVRDVFPYAMNNRGLTSQRLFTWLWNHIVQVKLRKKTLLTNLINVRNLFQVAVSADRRYGPIYNYGTAEVIRDELLRQGYRVGSGKPVSLIGYSGGGQIALGAATYLHPMLEGAPLRIISLGGVMADDPGLDYIEHLYHFYGTKDPVQQIGQIAYAGRWPILPHSPWNRAKADGKISMIAVGPIGHTGAKGYFSATCHLENGQCFRDRSVDAITRVLSRYADETVNPNPVEQPTPSKHSAMEG
jgi:hypothetical protein